MKKLYWNTVKKRYMVLNDFHANKDTERFILAEEYDKKQAATLKRKAAAKAKKEKEEKEKEERVGGKEAWGNKGVSRVED